jgi:hypothetical protein
MRGKMGLPGKNLFKKLTPFFNVLAGKQGKRAAFSTIAAITLECAAISFGIAALVGVFPITVAISAIGPLGCGIGIAFATAGSIKQHKDQKKERKAFEKIIAAQRETLKEQKKMLDAQSKSLGTVEDLERQILANQAHQPAATTAPKIA